MKLIKISRPQLPPGYADQPSSSLTWEFVATRLTEARHYWLCSVRPDGRPHAVPRWGVFLDDRFYYDGSPETRHSKNILGNPYVSLHLEDGAQAVIAEGSSIPVGKPGIELANRLVTAISAKYAQLGYSPKADQWDQGGLFVFTPHSVLAWTVFFENPTKFEFEEEK
jgi:hypothetical protein